MTIIRVQNFPQTSIGPHVWPSTITIKIIIIGMLLHHLHCCIRKLFRPHNVMSCTHIHIHWKIWKLLIIEQTCLLTWDKWVVCNYGQSLRSLNVPLEWFACMKSTNNNYYITFTWFWCTTHKCTTQEETWVHYGWHWAPDIGLHPQPQETLEHWWRAENLWTGI